MDSLWTTTWDLPRFAPLKEDIRADVLVIGGGMAGLLCGHMLRQAGANVVIAEAQRLCGGTTCRTTAKLTSQHGLIYHKLKTRYGTETAKGYYDANEAALSRFRAMAKTIDCDFTPAANHIYSQNDRAILEKEMAALQTAGIPATLSEGLPLPFPTEGAVTFQNQAQFHPLKFIGGILEGLRCYEETPVQDLHGDTAITPSGHIKADHIIVATHFPFLNKHGMYFMKLYQHRSYVLALKEAAACPDMYAAASQTGLSFRGYGDLLLLGGGSHHTGKPGGGYQELEQFVKTHYPKASIQSRWATQDCMTLDGMPYIGSYSRSTHNLYTATGFNKWGMTGSMVAATLLKDQILGMDNPYASLFSPSRTMLHTQLARNTVNSIAHIVTLRRPRCPHMGCALKWNPQEHSWDCPCHGSRFSENGTLLNNPATHDLEK